MVLVNVNRLSRETIAQDISNKIKGIPHYLVNGIYRDREVDLVKMTDMLVSMLEERMNVKIDRGLISLDYDDEDNLRLTYLDNVVENRNMDEFVNILTNELGFGKVITTQEEIKRSVMEVEVK